MKSDRERRKEVTSFFHLFLYSSVFPLLLDFFFYIILSMLICFLCPYITVLFSYQPSSSDLCPVHLLLAVMPGTTPLTSPTLLRLPPADSRHFQTD